MIPTLDETTTGAILAVAGGLLAAAVLVWILIRRGRPQRIDSPEDAATAVETLLGGARVCGAVVGADGTGALAVTDDGRVAAVKRRGRRLIAREVAWQAVRAIPGGILIETGDRQLGAVALTGVDALDIRRLTPRGLKA